MKIATFAVFATFIALNLSACGGGSEVRPINQTNRTVLKNYTIGEEQLAYVGEPIVSMKDYLSTPAFISPVAISASMEDMQTIQYPVGTKLVAIASVEYEDATYWITVPESPVLWLPEGARLLVDKNGFYRGLVIDSDNDVFELCDDEGDLCVTPKTINFTPSDSGHPVASGGMVNFEIVYSGATKDTINLLYREYTADNMARPAFTQNLVYDRTSSLIRFRDIKIQVVDVSNESLRFVVEADSS